LNTATLESRILEARIQRAVEKGFRYIKGKHRADGIGGRCGRRKRKSPRARYRLPGQRVGSMGVPNSVSKILGPASEESGGQRRGRLVSTATRPTDPTAMAQGKIYIAVYRRARHDPDQAESRFDPLNCGCSSTATTSPNYGGGIAAVCGYNPQDAEMCSVPSLLGWWAKRDTFRAHKGYSKPTPSWSRFSTRTGWLTANLAKYLTRLAESPFSFIWQPRRWQVLSAGPHESYRGPGARSNLFEAMCGRRNFGRGGCRRPRRLRQEPDPLIRPAFCAASFRPGERKYAAPCEMSCRGHTGAMCAGVSSAKAVWTRRLTRLAFTPFPLRCGYLCPNLCMMKRTRQSQGWPRSSDQTGRPAFGQSSELPPPSGKKDCSHRGGPAGISMLATAPKAKGRYLRHAPELGGKFPRSSRNRHPRRGESVPN